VVAEAADGEEAVRLVAEHRPDLVVMDVTMPVLDGVTATQQVMREHPETRVVILTMHGEPALVAQAVDAGACGFLTKDASMDEVVEALRQTAEGDVLLSPELAGAALAQFGDNQPPALTKRETEILQLVADGLGTAEIADRLFISAKTVKNHLASVYDKLGARDRTQAVLSAVRSGIIRLR
jgi:DNA-binding NarL/FixJ family response regulator